MAVLMLWEGLDARVQYPALAHEVLSDRLDGLLRKTAGAGMVVR